jgi:hypothetical protein
VVVLENKQISAGKKSWDTRRHNERKKDYQQRGKKATQTCRFSEYSYIDELVKMGKFERAQLFHHDGLPDLVAITTKRKLVFFEIKPKKGGRKRTTLNDNQFRTISELLKQDYVEKVNLVRYTNERNKIVYDEPISLTKENIREYCLR